jgi:hypothetical protein
MSLQDAHSTFRRWLGDDYDIGALDAVLATAAAEQLKGDPVWLLEVSGSGNAKTETVQALAGAGALVTSTITSEGALLSGTPAREDTTDATGGLLRRLGASGLLVVKDVTSILSSHRETRATVIAAFREIHDGRWERNIGSNGGRSITWIGRIAIIGAVTTAWDRAHDVIAAMGDRFVIVRPDSTTGRLSAGLCAMANTGAEVTMRAELAEAMRRVLHHVNRTPITLTAHETNRLLAAADVVTLSRTAVDVDYRGDVIDSHAPEMPTRFAKQLVQLVRGGMAIGMDRENLPPLVRHAEDVQQHIVPPEVLCLMKESGCCGVQVAHLCRALHEQLQELVPLHVKPCVVVAQAVKGGTELWSHCRDVVLQHLVGGS